MNFTDVFACPLCLSKKNEFHSHASPNLYSEKISRFLKLDEQELLDVLRNVRCVRCGLIFKRQWFVPSILRILFNELIQIHPRGWDTISGRFSPAQFFKELEFFKTAVEAGDAENKARWSRGLVSILSAIPDRDLRFNREECLGALESRKFKYFMDNQSLIAASFESPIDFSRFTGYSVKSLWDYVSHEIRPVATYAEIGCPLWGMYKIVPPGVKKIFLTRDEPNFWSDRCRIDGFTCVEAMMRENDSVEMMSLNSLNKHQIDLISVFQYLDHLENPLIFFKSIFFAARAALFVIEDPELTPPHAQHFTGWTAEAFQYAAKSLGIVVDDSYQGAKAQGHSVYLLRRCLQL